MKTGKPMRLEDVELVPDATERLEGAIKHAAQRRPAKTPGPHRVKPAKPKKRRATRRP
jgi:hypothetical protein